MEISVNVSVKSEFLIEYLKFKKENEKQIVKENVNQSVGGNVDVSEILNLVSSLSNSSASSSSSSASSSSSSSSSSSKVSKNEKGLQLLSNFIQTIGKMAVSKNPPKNSNLEELVEFFASSCDDSVPEDTETSTESSSKTSGKEDTPPFDE